MSRREREWLVTHILEGERVYFLSLRPTAAGTSDCAWTTQRGLATRFLMRRAAQDTADALRVGEVVSMWGHPEDAPS